MRKYFIYACCAIFLSSCARACQGCKKNTSDNTSQNVRVTMYSGGKVMHTWEFYGIVNNAEGGTCYFYYKNKLVELEGDFVIEHLD